MLIKSFLFFVTTFVFAIMVDKSDTIPESNDGPVTVVVGDQFEEIVMDPTRDVFVMYYAPWCGHCKNLAPTWERLGKSYASNPDLVIAKSDATSNKIEGFSVESYPTMYFYPKNNKEGIKLDHTGNRGVEEFQDWLNEHSPILDHEEYRENQKEIERRNKKKTKTGKRNQRRARKPKRSCERIYLGI